MSMQIPRNIIELSIKGGWEAPDIDKHTHQEHHALCYAYWSDIRNTLDPEFWKGLGKELGWDKEYCDGECPNVCRVHGGEFFFCSNEKCRCHTFKDTHWKTEAARFLNLILTGQDTTTFWESLITKK